MYPLSDALTGKLIVIVNTSIWNALLLNVQFQFVLMKLFPSPSYLFFKDYICLPLQAVVYIIVLFHTKSRTWLITWVETTEGKKCFVIQAKTPATIILLCIFKIGPSFVFSFILYMVAVISLTSLENLHCHIACFSIFIMFWYVYVYCYKFSLKTNV